MATYTRTYQNPRNDGSVVGFTASRVGAQEVRTNPLSQNPEICLGPPTTLTWIFWSLSKRRLESNRGQLEDAGISGWDVQHPEVWNDGSGKYKGPKIDVNLSPNQPKLLTPLERWAVLRVLIAHVNCKQGIYQHKGYLPPTNVTSKSGSSRSRGYKGSM